MLDTRKTRILSTAPMLLALAGTIHPAVAQPAQVTGSNADTSTAAGQFPAAATLPFTSTLLSIVANSTCADVTENNYLSLGMLDCNGTPSQDFEFQPVRPGSKKYVITNVGSGYCLRDYRSEVRQYPCSDLPVLKQYQLWTLRPVKAATKDYQIVQTINGSYEQCMNVTSTHATPPYVLWLAACLQGAEIKRSGAQTFHLEGQLP